MKLSLDAFNNIETGSGIGRNRSRGFIRNIRTFESMKNPVFRIFYGGMVGQMAGMNMQMFARTWLVWRLTESKAVTGLMGMAFAIPLLFLSLFGGVIADRMQKKNVMLVGQAVSGVLSLVVAITITMGYMSPEREGSWWILFVAGIFQGAVMGLMMPSRQAIIPEIVGEEQLMNAISLNNMGTNGLRIFAPAVTGFLIDTLDFAAVYYITTGLYFLSVLLMSFLPYTRAVKKHSTNALADIVAGLRYIRHETVIMLVLLFTLISVVLAMPYQMLLPALCDEVLNVGEAEGGTLMSIAGIGAIIGSITFASLPNRKRGLMLLLGGVLLGLSLTGFAFSTSWPLSMGLVVFVGLGQMATMTLGNTLVQYYVEEDYRGRVMSFVMMQFGLMGFATFIAGLLAEAFDTRWAIGGFAMVLAFIAILALIFIPKVRRLE